MLSKNCCFNLGIIRKNIQRFWLLPVAMFGLLWLTLGSLGEYYNEDFRMLLALGTEHILLYSVSFSLIAAMCCFSYLYRSTSAYMLHSLPVSRASMFWSNYVSGIILLYVPMLVFSIFIGIRQLSFDHWIFDPEYFKWLCAFIADFSLQILLFYSFAVFCAQLTGNIIVLPVLYVILNFTVPVIELLIRAMAEVFIYGMSDSFQLEDLTFYFLSPIVYVAAHLTHGSAHIAKDALLLDGWFYLIACGIAGIIFAVLSYQSYRRRDMECAGDVISHSFLRPVFKYCWTFGCAVVLGSIIHSFLYLTGNSENTWLPYTLCLLGGGFIGYFSAEMMLKKKLKVFRSGAKGFIFAAAVIIAVAGGFRFDIFGTASYIPKISDIESLSVTTDSANSYGHYYYVTADSNSSDIQAIGEWQKLHELLIDERYTSAPYVDRYGRGYYPSAKVTETANPTIVDPEGELPVLDYDDLLLYRQVEDSVQLEALYEVSFRYKLKDGRTVSRRYPMPCTMAMIKDGKSSAYFTDQLRNSPLIQSSNVDVQDFWRIVGGELYAMSYYIYQVSVSYDLDDQEKAAGIYDKETIDIEGRFSDSEAMLLIDALKKDAEAGDLFHVYFGIDDSYMRERTVLNFRIESVQDKGNGTTDIERCYIELNLRCSNTLQALHEIGMLK